jgi:hypothetical protein
MGWSEVAARSHARRLEREGWLCRYPMKRGEGCLFVATRRGVRMTDLPMTAAVAPAATWWAHLSACAWVAAWLTTRGRQIQGSREVLADPSWTGMLRWQDHNGVHRIGHRPDLAWLIDGQRVAIEVELAQKSIARLRAILDLHAGWRAAGKSAGVIYVCADEHGCARIRERAAESGLHLGIGGGLRVEPFEPSRSLRSRLRLATASQRLPVVPIAQIRRAERVALAKLPKSKPGPPHLRLAIRTALVPRLASLPAGFDGTCGR